MLKSYACFPERYRGRLHKEKLIRYVDPFEQDRDRIIQSHAFKRLQFKTQVFINHSNDHYRNRMTHSIEVSSIARSLTQSLNISSALAESIALSHDLGHTPFGHAGEDALNECMEHFGGFSHNLHTFKLLTDIEERYIGYNGLNLTWEVLEGIIKHNGPITDEKAQEYKLHYNLYDELDINKYPSLEAQIANIADDITYISHDIQDAIGACLISCDHLSQIKFIDRFLDDIKNIHQRKKHDIDPKRLVNELSTKIVNHFIEDILFQTLQNIEKYKIQTLHDIRSLDKPIVHFTEHVANDMNDIKDFLMSNVYMHSKVRSIATHSKTMIKDLFKLYINNIDMLPVAWKNSISTTHDAHNRSSLHSRVAEYIAGMTDRFAIKQHQYFYNTKAAEYEYI